MHQQDSAGAARRRAIRGGRCGRVDPRGPGGGERGRAAGRQGPRPLQVGLGSLTVGAQRARATHVAICNSLANLHGSGKVAASAHILHGRLVTSKGVKGLMGKMDVDRALVCGSSLDADLFLMIFNKVKDAGCKKQVNKGGVHCPSRRRRRRLPHFGEGKYHAYHNHCILVS